MILLLVAMDRACFGFFRGLMSFTGSVFIVAFASVIPFSCRLPAYTSSIVGDTPRDLKALLSLLPLNRVAAAIKTTWHERIAARRVLRGALTSTPVGLTPTEHASLRWTH